MKKLIGKTRILVTHAIDFLKFADKIVVLKKGKFALNGTYEELKNSNYMLEITDIHKSNTKISQNLGVESFIQINTSLNSTLVEEVKEEFLDEDTTD
jgi:ABC-type proline/glycine betaine transport system ATPase subunit